MGAGQDKQPKVPDKAFKNAVKNIKESQEKPKTKEDDKINDEFYEAGALQNFNAVNLADKPKKPEKKGTKESPEKASPTRLNNKLFNLEDGN